MSQDNSALQQGIDSIKRGDKKGGATILANVVRSSPQSAEAWFWLAAATENPNEAKLCLQRVLQIEPGHTRARQALDVIEKGGTPSVASFTGDSSRGAEPSAPNMRPLNTGELLGSAMDASPYGSYSPTASPPPNPYGAPAAPPSNPYGAPAAPPASNFGNEPTPPPPFGMPAWANQADKGSNATMPSMPSPPPFPSSSPPPSNFAPPPAFQPTTGALGGIRVAELDPVAAAQQRAAAQQAQQAQVQRDTGADLRASLLNPAAFQAPPSNMPPPANDPRNSKNVKGTEATPRKQPKPSSGKARISPLLIIVLVVLLLVTAGVIIYSLLKPKDDTPIALTTTTAVASPATDVTVTVIATTAASATTAPVATTAVVPATTAPIATTAAPIAVATTAVVPATTAAPVATTAAPTATTAATPVPAGSPQPTREGQILATATPFPTINGQIPVDIDAYVKQGNAWIEQIEFVITGELKRVAVLTAGATPGPGTPYETVNGKCTADESKNRDCQNIKSPLVRDFITLAKESQKNPNLGYRFCFDGSAITRTNFTTCTQVNNVSAAMQFNVTQLGQFSKQFKSAYVPAGVRDLGLVANDYSVAISEMATQIDQYFSTGDVKYLNEAVIFYDKAVRERDRWRGW